LLLAIALSLTRRLEFDQQNQRLKELERTRAHLEDEKASYKGRQMPDAMKAAFEANRFRYGGGGTKNRADQFRDEANRREVRR